MSGPLATLGDPPSDGELISAVRAGDTDAYGELFARHVDAARRLARQLVPAADADDLVSEAFAKVLVVLQRGGGPDLAFRAYLLTAVRRLHVDRIRRTARLHTTGDLTPFDPGVPFRDTTLEGFESAAAARAFASLPERWQLVLWHTEVEQQKPAEVAGLLGMTPNSVSALAYRAREGLRQAYLSMHTQDVDDDACARTRADLGAFVRGGLSRRDSARVEQHLRECRACAAIYLELSDVNSRLGAVLAPLLLGSAGAAYVGTSGSSAATVVAGVVALLDRAKDAVAAHAATVAVSGAAASVAGAAVVVGLLQGGPDLPAARETPPAQTVPSGAPTDQRTPHRERRTAPPRKDGPRAPVSRASASATAAGDGTGAPAASPTSTPATTSAPQAPTSASPSTASPSTGPPTTPAPTPTPPLVQADVEVSAGPDGVTVGATLGALGATLPPVQITVPGLPGGLAP